MASYYTTPGEVRLRLGLTEDDASDIHLNKLIIDAQQMMLEELAGQRIDEELAGTINGVNQYFYTEKPFIADQNFDKIVDKDDVIVYLWTDSSDPTTKSAATVSAIDTDIGQIKLSTAPPSTIVKITCNYRFYNAQVSWVLVNLATAYLAGYLWVLRDRLLLPDSVGIGSIRWRISFPQWRELIEEYKRIMHRLRGKMVVHGKTSLPKELTGTIPSERGFSRVSRGEIE